MPPQRGLRPHRNAPCGSIPPTPARHTFLFRFSFLFRRCLVTSAPIKKPRASRPSFFALVAAALLAAGLCPGGLSSAHGQQAFVPAVNLADRAAVLGLYRDYYLTSEGVLPGWTGSVAFGSPGTISTAYQIATLRRINYYRAMSGLPGNVVLDPAVSAKCQQAALMMAAEGNVSHHPLPSWRYYTVAAAEAAANSDLALDTRNDEGPGAIDRYIADDGPANPFVGHRRWLLYAGTTTTGLGIVPPETGNHPGTNATWVRGSGPATLPGVRPSVAWPPAGYVPAPLVYTRWSFSYPNADFSRATVRVTKNGVPLAVVLEPLGCQSLPNGTGMSAGNNTLAWTLPGNVAGRFADECYEVRVDNVAIADGKRQFRYPVTSIPVTGNSLGNREMAGNPPSAPNAPTMPNRVAYTLADARRNR